MIYIKPIIPSFSIQFILNRLHYFLLGHGAFPPLVGNNCIITRLNRSQPSNRIYNINYFAHILFHYNGLVFRYNDILFRYNGLLIRYNDLMFR